MKIQSKPTGIVEGPLEKWCGKCKRVLPLAAFRKDATKPKGADAYCKACRREYSINNRDKANARWTNWRLSQPKEPPTEEDRIKRNARQMARRYSEPDKCIVPRCTNRGERHHHLGYAGPNAKKVIPLCRPHHALEHILERARTASGPTYF